MFERLDREVGLPMIVFQYPEAAGCAYSIEALSRIDTGPYVIVEEQVAGRSPELERHAVVYTLEDGLIVRERILRA